MHRIAGNLRFRGQHDSALALYREALDLGVRSRGPEHTEVALAMLYLADQLALGDTIHYEESEGLYKEALAMQRRLLGEDYPNLVHGLGGLADLANKRGRYEEADAYQRQSIDLRLRTLGPDNAVIAQAYGAYGNQRARMDDWAGALRYYGMALPLLRRHLGEGPDLASMLITSARAWLELGQPDSAVSQAAEAIGIYRATVGADNWRLADAYSTSGRAQQSAGRYAAAETAFREARRIYGGAAPATAAFEPDPDSLLARLYRTWDREPAGR